MIPATIALAQLAAWARYRAQIHRNVAAKRRESCPAVRSLGASPCNVCDHCRDALLCDARADECCVFDGEAERQAERAAEAMRDATAEGGA